MQFSAVPQELRSLNAWLVWKFVQCAGEPKPRKVPMYVGGGARRGVQGCAEDRAKLASFDAAVARFAKGGVDGIGLAMLPEWGLVALDFDECVQDGVIDEEVESLVAGTYTEFSPSGRGVRAFMRGAVADKKSRTADGRWGVEFFHAKGFVTITGNTTPTCELLGSEIVPLTDRTEALFEERFSMKATAPSACAGALDDDDPFAGYEPKVGLSLGEMREALAQLDPSMGQDEGWLSAGMAIHHETDGSDDGFELWDVWSSGGGQYPGTESLRRRWDSFGRGRRDKVITARWLLKRASLKKQAENPVLDANDYMDMARKFMDKHFQTEEGVALLRAGGMWYENVGPCYREEADDIINSMMWKWLDKSLKHAKNEDGETIVVPFKPSKNKVDGVTAALRAHTVIKNATPPCWLPGYQGPEPSELVSLANGLLHIPTRTLMPHTPGLFNVNALPYEWQERGEPVEWLKFLDSVWGSDKESIDTLQEIMGYLVTADTSQQKMFFIKGPKRSGKGTIGRILAAMLGTENVVSPQFSGLAERFGLEPLVNKLAAIIPDGRIDRNNEVVVERLLMISGEDNITVDRKNEKQWTGKLFARVVLFSNEVPYLKDVSGALAGRFIVLNMNRSFYGQEDHGLTPRLMKELPAIFRWALEGRDRLATRGHFCKPGSGREVLEDVEEFSSPIKTFVREECELDIDGKVLKADLYATYRQWCHDSGQSHPMAINRFSNQLTTAFPSIGHARPRADNPDRKEYYVGIRKKLQVEEGLDLVG